MALALPSAQQSAVLLLAAACAAAGLVAHPPDASLAAPSKPFTTFGEFYPLYLEQHSHPTTKLLHAIGTARHLRSAATP